MRDTYAALIEMNSKALQEDDIRLLLEAAGSDEDLLQILLDAESLPGDLKDKYLGQDTTEDAFQVVAFRNDLTEKQRVLALQTSATLLQGGFIAKHVETHLLTGAMSSEGLEELAETGNRQIALSLLKNALRCGLDKAPKACAIILEKADFDNPLQPGGSTAILATPETLKHLDAKQLVAKMAACKASGGERVSLIDTLLRQNTGNAEIWETAIDEAEQDRELQFALIDLWDSKSGKGPKLRNLSKLAKWGSSVAHKQLQDPGVQGFTLSTGSQEQVEELLPRFESQMRKQAATRNESEGLEAVEAWQEILSNPNLDDEWLDTVGLISAIKGTSIAAWAGGKANIWIQNPEKLEQFFERMYEGERAIVGALTERPSPYYREYEELGNFIISILLDKIEVDFDETNPKQRQIWQLCNNSKFGRSGPGRAWGQNGRAASAWPEDVRSARLLNQVQYSEGGAWLVRKLLDEQKAKPERFAEIRGTANWLIEGSDCTLGELSHAIDEIRAPKQKPEQKAIRQIG